MEADERARVRGRPHELRRSRSDLLWLGGVGGGEDVAAVVVAVSLVEVVCERGLSMGSSE
jgi:hypothetical protein